MWKHPLHEETWRNDERVAKIVKKMEDLCSTVKTYEFGTIANDAIARDIF